MRPSAVHSVNETSHSRTGFTQWTARHSPAPSPTVSARLSTGVATEIFARRSGQFSRRSSS